VGRDIILLLLNLGTRWKRVVNFMLWPIYSRERNPIPTE